MRTLIFIGFVLIMIFLSGDMFAQSSVLNAGSWYKVAVDKSGVYKITYNQFREMGFPSSIDPRTIKLYGNEGGMLPQSNAISRATDLIENSIFIEGENDAVFNSNDYIIFFAQGPDLIKYDQARESFKYESNLYSDKNFYFLTVSDGAGKRITTAPTISGTHPVIKVFDDYVYHEVDEYNELQSGREWYGEKLEAGSDQSFAIELPGIVENSDITFVSDVVGQSKTGPSTFQVFMNNFLIGQQTTSSIPNLQYGTKGHHKRDTIRVNANSITSAGVTNQVIKYQTLSGKGYLDLFLLTVQRKLALYGAQTIFRSSLSLDNATSTFEIENTTSNSRVWNVTNPSEAVLQESIQQDNKISFSTNTDVLKEFIVFTNELPAPERIGKVVNQNLHGATTPNLILVTHPDFKIEAQRLANHREAQSQWTTMVVTPEEIYNEFSSGRQDVSAIRDFAKHAYDKNPSALKAVLLLGKSSYDYKERVSNNTNFVATYESRNSLSPLESYSSDDYYGFLESNEGNWGESAPLQNHTLDIGIGRLPVKTEAEAKSIVDKIIAYDTLKKNFGKWRKNIVFVADDGSISDGFSEVHQSQANTIATTIETNSAGFDTKKIFLGTYTKTVKPNGESIPEATTDIEHAFNRGSIIINYTGHGSEKVWADERILTDLIIEKLENSLYPFLVTATCAFGRSDDPHQISSAELIVLKAQGGAIGLVTTARDVYASTNFELNKAFYAALFDNDADGGKHLGEVFRHTKNNSTIGVGNRNFSLLADPSLTLAMPSLDVRVTSIETTTGSDTLKALSTVIVKGEIHDENGMILEKFNGSLEATLFDKQTEFVTIGKNDPPFTYKQWSNILFQGKATVRQGIFEFTFMIPKNIAYEIAPGKLSLYAADTTNLLNVAGATSAFKIGGSESNPISDNTPPTVSLFMGDTTFVNGGIVSPTTTLIARLEDTNGINISNYGIGNNLIAILDDNSEIFLLNDFYQSDADDFTRGWVNFPMKDLTPGKHTLTVKAWDTHNNSGQAQIEFIVTEGEALVIESFANYPNPFFSETTLYFTHNRSGDDLEGELIIYESNGRALKTYPFTILNSPYKVVLLESSAFNDFTKNLPGGLYLARIVIRSLSNGTKNERVTKLITVK